jgi:hypothetical protein
MRMEIASSNNKVMAQGIPLSKKHKLKDYWTTSKT